MPVIEKTSFASSKIMILRTEIWLRSKLGF